MDRGLGEDQLSLACVFKPLQVELSCVVDHFMNTREATTAVHVGRHKWHLNLAVSRGAKASWRITVHGSLFK